MAKRSKSAIGRQNRAKGAAFEREVVALLAPLYPDARRNLSQTRTAKKEGPDILGCPWWLELTCGRVSPSELAAKWEQACDDANEGRDGYGATPVVIAKRTRQEPMVLMWARTAGIVDAPAGTQIAMSLGAWLALLRVRSSARVIVNPDPTEPFEVGQ